MKWDEIKKHYKNEWVLIDVLKTDRHFNVREGNVLAHSKSKEDIYDKLLKLKPKSVAIEYTGKIPDDLAVVLVCEDI